MAHSSSRCVVSQVNALNYGEWSKSAELTNTLACVSLNNKQYALWDRKWERTLVATLTKSVSTQTIPRHVSLNQTIHPTGFSRLYGSRGRECLWLP